MSSTVDAKTFSNISATTAAFPLKGGRYLLAASGTITTVQLQLLSPDALTWINLGTALSAAGSNTVDLPPGSYRVNISGTAIFVLIAGVPGQS